MHPMFSECLSGAASKMLAYVLAALDEPEARPLSGNTGLPAHGIECPGVGISLFPTPVTEQLFAPALLRLAQRRRQSALLIRHGFHPETLDPVRIDVAVPLPKGAGLIGNLSFYRSWDGRLHLVPDSPGIGVSFTRAGIGLQQLKLWDDLDERAEGLERAAAEIVRLCRRTASRR